jgi:hypothetical protein
MKRINKLLDRAAVAITSAVGSMWCAIIFSLLALTSLPDVISMSVESASLAPVIQWIAQTFLQLVLLSIILKGQNIAGERQERIIKQINENTAKAEAAAERIEHIVKMIERITAKELEEIKKAPEIKTKE